MKALDEFTESVSSLKKEVENLQTIKQAYQQLATLAEDYEQIVGNFLDATKDLGGAKVAMERQISEVNVKLAEQKKLLRSELVSMHEKLSQKLVDFEKLIEGKADHINESNKKFYNDFANTVQTRLDNNKMEIKYLMDQDSNRTRQQIYGLEQEFKKQTENMTKQFSETQLALAKQMMMQKKISLAFGIVVTVLTLVTIILKFVI